MSCIFEYSYLYYIKLFLSVFFSNLWHITEINLSSNICKYPSPNFRWAFNWPIEYLLTIIHQQIIMKRIYSLNKADQFVLYVHNTCLCKLEICRVSFLFLKNTSRTRTSLFRRKQIAKMNSIVRLINVSAVYYYLAVYARFVPDWL
jgi:hypothetical protein